MIAALAVALLPLTQHTSCDLNTGLITSRSVGTLTIGEAVRDLRRRCPSVRDTVFVTAAEVGSDTLPALVASVKGGSVLAFVERGRVHSLLVTTPGPTTTDSLTVGTSIRRFSHMSGVRISANDHGPLSPLTLAGRCGITFFFSGWGPVPIPEEGVTYLVRHELERWPNSIRVASVSIYGCEEKRRRDGAI